MVHVTHGDDIDEVAEVLGRGSEEVHVDRPSRRITAKAGGVRDMLEIGGPRSTPTGIAVDDIGLARPSLDDVFLHLTGHRAEESGDETEEAAPSDRRVRPAEPPATPAEPGGDPEPARHGTPASRSSRRRTCAPAC